MANIRGMIVAELNRKRSVIVENLARLDAFIAEFGGKASVKAGAKRGPKTGKRTLSPEHIAKMQAGRAARKEVKGSGANLAAAAGE